MRDHAPNENGNTETRWIGKWPKNFQLCDVSFPIGHLENRSGISTCVKIAESRKADSWLPFQGCFCCAREPNRIFYFYIEHFWRHTHRHTHTKAQTFAASTYTLSRAGSVQLDFSLAFPFRFSLVQRLFFPLFLLHLIMNFSLSLSRFSDPRHALVFSDQRLLTGNSVRMSVAGVRVLLAWPKVTREREREPASTRQQYNGERTAVLLLVAKVAIACCSY